MKILTGDLKGQKIVGGQVSATLRPTSDKARKAIFDVLQGAFENKRVLDVFAGTGALGLEALSQRAETVVFVEKERSSAAAIERNLERLGLKERGRVITGEVPVVLKRLFDDQIYDFIFLDPPYQTPLGLSTLEMLEASPLWHEDTIFLLECHAKEKPPAIVGALNAIKAKLYGDTQVIFYKKAKN